MPGDRGFNCIADRWRFYDSNRKYLSSDEAGDGFATFFAKEQERRFREVVDEEMGHFIEQHEHLRGELHRLYHNLMDTNGYNFNRSDVAFRIEAILRRLYELERPEVPDAD